MATYPHYGTSPASLSTSYLHRHHQSLASHHESDDEDEHPYPVNETPTHTMTLSQASDIHIAHLAGPSAPSSPNMLPISPRIKARHLSISEHTPLLESHASTRAIYAAEESTPPVRSEVALQIRYTIPIFVTHLLELSLVTAATISIGHIGAVELASSSIAGMTCNVVALSIIQGICSALDTLCPQAWSSSKPEMTGVHALRVSIVLLIALIPQIIILCNAEYLLLALRQDPKVAQLAGLYLKYLCIGLPGYATFECSRRWLQAQGLMLIPTYCVCAAAPLNILLNYLLCWSNTPLKVGFIGAPIASAASMLTMGALSLGYCIFFAPRKGWAGFTKDVLDPKAMWDVVWLSLAGIALLSSEWYAWEIVALCSSYLGTDSLAAQSILLTTASFLYQLSYSLSAAAAVRVGNLLGAFQPQSARKASHVSIGLGVCIGVFNSALLIINHNRWGYIFTSDPVLIRLVGGVLPLVGLFQLTDSITGVASGLFRGAGKSPMGAAINICAYWVLGLPIGLLLAFHPHIAWGLKGLWSGLTIALTFTAILTTTYITRLDWYKAAQVAQERSVGLKEEFTSERPNAALSDTQI